MTRPADVPADTLIAGEPQERSFDDKAPHAYEVEVAAGHLLRVTADQRGVDTVVRLFSPGGELLMAADSPSGSQGTETVSAVADEAGLFRVEIHPGSAGDGARYEIRIDDLRPASDDDRLHVAAQRSFAHGEETRRGKDFAAAKEHYEKALRSFRDLGDRPGEAHTLYRIGWCESELGNRREAAERLRLAAKRFAALGDRAGELTALNRLGVTLRDDGRPDEAIEVLQRAVRTADMLDDPYRSASAVTFLGDAYRYAQHSAAAIETYRRAVDLWAAQSDQRRPLAATWARLAELYLTLGRLDEARNALERAREVDVGSDLLLPGTIELQLGNLAARSGKTDDAREHLRRSLELAEAREDTRAQVAAHSGLGSLALDRGRIEDSDAHFETALKLARRMGSRGLEGMMLHKKARVRYAAGDLDGSEELFREAIALLERSNERQGVASARFGIARILHQRRAYAEARDVLEEILRSADDLRSDSEIPDLQMSYVDRKHHYWELYVDTLMHLEEEGWTGSADRALAVTESWRARNLVELLEEAGVDVRQDADDQLLAREERAQRDLNAFEMRRLDLLGKHDPEEMAEAERGRMAALADLRHVRAEIRRSSKLLRDLNPASAQSVLQSSAISDVQQSHLDRDTLILVYALGEERSFAWTVSVDAVRHHVLPPREEIENLAATVRELLQSPAPSDAERRAAIAARLADRVLVPLLEGAGYHRRLVVVADGALLHVPFAALPVDDGQGGRIPALAHHEVVHLPSATTLIALRNAQELRRRGRGTAPGVAAVIADPVLSAADPRLDRTDAGATEPGTTVATPLDRVARDVTGGELPRLPATAREAEMIRGLVPEDAVDDVLMAQGFDASRELVTSGRLAGYRIVHFATHGLLDHRHPDVSGLVLSLYDRRGRRQDGFLRLHEIYGLDLPAELVVLSACETGDGREFRGEGLVGLARGFMYAGAPRLVVSLWKVDDDDTAELMWRFYHLLLRENLTPAEALRLAQLSLVRDPEWSAPHHWAGFVLVGDWRLDRSLGDPDRPIEQVDAGGDPEDPAPRPDDDLPIPDVPPRPPADRS